MQHPMLNIAINAARSAGRIIIRHVDRIEQVNITAKGRNDLVTEVDKLAEQEIIHQIHKAYPSHSIIAEESGEHQQGQDDFCWIIDPLDGTMNFVHGFPQFCTSIALKQKGKLLLAAIYDPIANELFTAVKGKGAQVNNRRMRTSKINTMQDAMIGTGFPFRENSDVDTYLAAFKNVMCAATAVRRAGSAALDLAYVACGRLDGFWEGDLHQWDTAAGILMVREAGGHCTDLTGNPDCVKDGGVIATNANLHQALQALVS
jgi:myo-inositol-1(or 4)-monophosphatase